MESLQNLQAEDLAWMVNVTNTYPSTANMLNLTTAFAINGKINEAELWIENIKKVTSKEDYEVMKRIWDVQERDNPSLSYIKWP